MRWVLVLLVLANLVSFAWWQTRAGAAGGTVPEEIAPQRIRVVPMDRLGAASPPSIGGLMAARAPER